MPARPAPAPARTRLELDHCEDRLAPASFTVTTDADAGPGSLRDAILQANDHPGVDVIAFDIGSGSQTIKVLTALPTITDRVAIAGQTQPGYAGSPLIQVNGDSAGAGVNGLVIRAGASGSVVRGLNIEMFNGDGIRLRASHCRIVGNTIGVVPDGSHEESNAGNGIFISGQAVGNVIGGAAAGAGNVISGNDTNGILILGNGANGNVIIGNLIGTDVTGTDRIANGVAGTPSLMDGAGVRIAEGASGNVVGGVAGAGNVISANTDYGVAIDDTGSTGNVVLGNLIGTDVSGTAALGNALAGVLIDGGATGNLVGGVRNVISGNNGDGVVVSGVGTAGNRVLGNLIGTDRSGTAAVPNFGVGVRVGQGASGNAVGALGAGNVISGNDSGGVAVAGSGTTGNRVQGNRIGLAVTGGAAVGNVGDGVRVAGGATGNVVGGTAFGTGNLIAHSGDAGVAILPDSSAVILGNRIFANDGLGIDLLDDGVTPNDLGDADAGPNGLQNFPQLADASILNGALHVRGSLNTQAGKLVRIEFFASPAADISGFGEGQTHLGSVVVDTSGGTTVNFAAVLSAAGVQPGDVITATATDNAGNTSEFSAAITVG